MEYHPFTRRTFLAATAAMVAGSAELSAQPVPEWRSQPPGRPLRPAKNLIFMCADGLSLGALTLGDLVSQKIRGRQLRWLEWMGQQFPPYRSLLATGCADRIVTDSAASASAWSTGKMVNLDAINMTPDGVRHEPLFVRLKKMGFVTGAVTNTSILDATPAAMVASAARRTDFVPIAEQMIAGNHDLLMGGGAARFAPEVLARATGHDVVRTLDEAKALVGSAKPMLGLLGDGNLPPAIEREAGDPTFAQLTTFALDRMSTLAGAQGRFAVMLETEDTDNAAHDNDGATLARAVIDFDEGIEVALEFCERNPETLLIVTTDHANANPGFARYSAADHAQMDALCAAKRSFRTIMSRVRSAEGPKGGKEIAAEVLDGQGVTLSDYEIDVLDRWIAKEQVDPSDQRNRGFSPLGSVVGNHSGVSFLSNNHTADHVLACAQGLRSHLLPPMGHLVDVHRFMLEALGIRS